LQEDVAARDLAAREGRRDRLAGAGLEVVPPLVRGVDRAEAGGDRLRGEARGLRLLPRRPVEEARDPDARHLYLASESGRGGGGGGAGGLAGSIVGSLVGHGGGMIAAPALRGFTLGPAPARAKWLRSSLPPGAGR